MNEKKSSPTLLGLESEKHDKNKTIYEFIKNQIRFDNKSSESLKNLFINYKITCSTIPAGKQYFKTILHKELTNNKIEYTTSDSIINMTTNTKGVFFEGIKLKSLTFTSNSIESDKFCVNNQHILSLIDSLNKDICDLSEQKKSVLRNKSVFQFVCTELQHKILDLVKMLITLDKVIITLTKPEFDKC